MWPEVTLTAIKQVPINSTVDQTGLESFLWSLHAFSIKGKTLLKLPKEKSSDTSMSLRLTVKVGGGCILEVDGLCVRESWYVGRGTVVSLPPGRAER